MPFVSPSKFSWGIFLTATHFVPAIFLFSSCPVFCRFVDIFPQSLQRYCLEIAEQSVLNLRRTITMSSSDDDYASYSNREESNDSEELETLTHIAACEKRGSKKRSKTAKLPSKSPKRQAAKNKSSATSSAVVRSRSVSYSSDELLLVSKAFMKVSCDAKHSTDKKAEKFWEEVSIVFEELVATANKMNESNPEFSPIEPGRSVESIRNCWQRKLQPAVQKFAGIIQSSPPTSGEVHDDALMDLYYSRIRHEYQARSKSYAKDMPKTFDKLMKSFHFLSKHPKFEVEFPTNRSKPPTKHPNSVRCADPLDNLSNTNFDPETSESFMRLLKRKE